MKNIKETPISHKTSLEGVLGSNPDRNIGGVNKAAAILGAAGVKEYRDQMAAKEARVAERRRRSRITSRSVFVAIAKSGINVAKI